MLPLEHFLYVGWGYKAEKWGKGVKIKFLDKFWKLLKGPKTFWKLDLSLWFCATSAPLWRGSGAKTEMLLVLRHPRAIVARKWRKTRWKNADSIFRVLRPYLRFLTPQNTIPTSPRSKFQTPFISNPIFSHLHSIPSSSTIIHPQIPNLLPWSLIGSLLGWSPLPPCVARIHWSFLGDGMKRLEQGFYIGEVSYSIYVAFIFPYMYSCNSLLFC